MEIDCEIRIKRPGVRHRSRIPGKRILKSKRLDEVEEAALERVCRIAQKMKGGKT